MQKFTLSDESCTHIPLTAGLHTAILNDTFLFFWGAVFGLQSLFLKTAHFLL